MAHSPHWVFGYGSLIYRPAFPYQARLAGFVHGWTRRFWQGSPDHRGTPERPGRVVTLVEEVAAVCWGVAYLVAPDQVPAVMSGLDHRESGGYDRRDVSVQLDGRAPVSAVMYVATSSNPNFIGDAPLPDMARHVLGSTGASGPNVEYVTGLAQALRELGVASDPAFDLEAEIQVMMSRTA